MVSQPCAPSTARLLHTHKAVGHRRCVTHRAAHIKPPFFLPRTSFTLLKVNASLIQSLPHTLHLFTSSSVGVLLLHPPRLDCYTCFTNLLFSVLPMCLYHFNNPFSVLMPKLLSIPHISLTYIISNHFTPIILLTADVFAQSCAVYYALHSYVSRYMSLFFTSPSLHPALSIHPYALAKVAHL